MKSPFFELAELKATGELAIIWFNQYSATCIKSDDATVVVDPVEVEADEILKAESDITLVSHEHFDHFDGDIIRELKDKSEIITNKTVADELDFDPEVMRPDDSIERKGVVITGKKSDHPGEEPLTFLLEFKSLSIYHSIDSKPYEEMERLEPDVLIVPIGIAPGVTAKTGVEITDLVLIIWGEIRKLLYGDLSPNMVISQGKLNLYLGDQSPSIQTSFPAPIKT